MKFQGACDRRQGVLQATSARQGPGPTVDHPGRAQDVQMAVDLHRGRISLLMQKGARVEDAAICVVAPVALEDVAQQDQRLGVAATARAGKGAHEGPSILFEKDLEPGGQLGGVTPDLLVEGAESSLRRRDPGVGLDHG